MKAVTEAIMQLTTERDRIDMAIKALGHLNNFAEANIKPERKNGKRRFTAAARAKMRDAQRKRWAAWRKEHSK